MNIYKRLVAEPQSVFIHTTLCILAILLALPIASLALPLWLIFASFQWFTAAWILFWRMGKILATQDVPFAQGFNPRNFITCLFTVKGSLSVRTVRRAFCTKILQSTADESHVRLKQCVQSKMGRFIRSDEENFDIKKHIFVRQGAPPNTDESLVECYCELINRAIPSNISPWQLIIIPRGNRRGEKSFAICVRIHHTIGDGYALVGLFTKVVDNKPEFIKPVMKQPQSKKAGILRVLRAIFTGPFVLLCILLTKIENPFRRKESRGEIKVAWTKPIDLADIKRSKTKFGATINDVLTACLAGAIRRYLTDSGVASPHDLQIAITINTRTPSSVLNGQIPLENNTTGVFFSLPVATSTMVERVLETKRRMDLVKSSSEHLLFGFLFKYFIATLPGFLARFSSHTINKCCCMIMSNVPGPLNQLVLEGKVVESAMVWPPLVSDTGISVAVFSYAGKIRVTVKVDSAVISDPTVLIDNFMKEVEDLVRHSQ